jgi:hypothetical protein
MIDPNNFSINVSDLKRTVCIEVPAVSRSSNPDSLIHLLGGHDSLKESLQNKSSTM